METDDEMDPDFLEEVKHAVKGWVNENEKLSHWSIRQRHAAGTQESADESQEREDQLLKTLKALHFPTVKAEPVSKKRRTSQNETAESNTNNQVRRRERGKPNQTQTIPQTMKELALYILKHCKDEDDLGTFEMRFLDNTNKEIRDIKPEGKNELVDKIKGYDNSSIVQILFLRVRYFAKSFKQEEAYGEIESDLFPVSRLKNELRDLFQSKKQVVVSSADDSEHTIEDFVIVQPKHLFGDHVSFPIDMERGSAVVVTGESGAGKSWFATKYLPRKRPHFSHASFIYHNVDIKTEDDLPGPDDEKLGPAYQTAMEAWKTKSDAVGDLDSPVYKALSELSRQYNNKRHKYVTDMFNELMLKALEGNQTARRWWKSRWWKIEKKVSSKWKLDELVIILDDMENAPNLARALVDQVKAEEYEREKYASAVGPSKANVIYLRGPNLEKRETIFGVPKHVIMSGTYSQVLATNTRMLMRGVVPILKSYLHTLGVDNLDLPARQIVLGSTNCVMDYAARVSIERNGLLRRQDPVELEAVLLKQFRLLLHCELLNARNASRNPIFANLIPYAEWHFYAEYEEVLKCGLITADVQSTSKAMRYLACKGQTAPLDAQGGIAFEVILQHHLVRLSKAQYDLELRKRRKGSKQEPTYFCERYSLVQAWPPSSTKGNHELDTEEDVKKELAARYEHEKTKNTLRCDISEISKLVQGKAAFDLVLRQTNDNAQGADIMVLSKRGVKVFLDLYRAKHCSKLPALVSQETIKAFASLGVFYDIYEGFEMPFDAEPQTGSAGYSYLGTQQFVDELSIALDTMVVVRKRVLVFSLGWESFVENVTTWRYKPSFVEKGTTWSDFDFEGAKDNNIWLWTKEMMEPTVSALVSRPACNVSDEQFDGLILL